MIRERAVTPALSGQPANGDRQVMLVRAGPQGPKGGQGRAGRDRSDGKCRSHRVQREIPVRQARQAHRDRKEKQVRLARWGQPDLRGRRATRGRHKSVFVWGRRALLRQTAMAGFASRYRWCAHHRTDLS